MIIVIGIIAILAVVAIPSFIGVIDQTHAATCTSNRHNIELMLAVESVENPDLDLQVYLATVPTKFYCPTGGTYTADENGHIICSEHTNGADRTELPYVKPKKDTVLYKSNMTYNKGDVVWQAGRRYRATLYIANSSIATPTGNAWGWELVE